MLALILASLVATITGALLFIDLMDALDGGFHGYEVVFGSVLGVLFILSILVLFG